jgi:hypothetical protein
VLFASANRCGRSASTRQDRSGLGVDLSPRGGV